MLDASPRRGVLGRQFIDIHRERSEAILQVVDAGWKLASTFPSAHAGAGEVEITECLRDGMRAALGERATDWSRKMTVLAGTRITFGSRGSQAGRAHGRAHLLQRHPGGVQRARSARDRRVQTGRRESRRTVSGVRRGRRRPVRDGQVRAESRGRLHGRVPAFGRRRIGSGRHQCAPDPQAASVGTSWTLRHCRPAVGEEQSSSARRPGRAHRPSSRFLLFQNRAAAGTFARAETVTQTELRERIANGEHSGVEFTSDAVAERRLAEHLVAFANLRGGHVLFGVDDSGSVLGLTTIDPAAGTDAEDDGKRGYQRLEEWVMQACRDKIRPEIIPYFEILRDVEPGRDVAVVQVERGWSVHHVWHNQRRTYCIRVGSLSREAGPEELARLFQQRGTFRPELRPVSGTSLAALDRRRLEDYFRQVRQQDAPLSGPSDEWRAETAAWKTLAHEVLSRSRARGLPRAGTG